MSEEQIRFIKDAVEVIQKGLTGKIVSPDKSMQVYACGGVIRIDIKR